MASSLVNNKYRITRRIGGGSFGEIYMGVGPNNEKVAVKFERHGSRCPQLRHEYKVYRELTNCHGFASVYHFGTQDNYNVMVMDLLGPSLEDLFNKCNRRFSLKTVLQIADQMLERADTLHSRHLIHRDIKPANFVIGVGENAANVFCVDFGLSKRYRHPKNLHHIPHRDGRSLTGTPRYASINNHLGIEQSRRDDLESIGYVLIYFLKGSLPWQGLKAKNAQKKYRLILEKKQQVSIAQLCQGCPSQFAEFLAYTRSLKFDAKPDIPYLRKLFRDLYHAQGCGSVPKLWDWDNVDSDYLSTTGSAQVAATPAIATPSGGANLRPTTAAAVAAPGTGLEADIMMGAGDEGMDEGGYGDDPNRPSTTGAPRTSQGAAWGYSRGEQPKEYGDAAGGVPKRPHTAHGGRTGGTPTYQEGEDPDAHVVAGARGMMRYRRNRDNSAGSGAAGTTSSGQQNPAAYGTSWAQSSGQGRAQLRQQSSAGSGIGAAGGVGMGSGGWNAYASDSRPKSASNTTNQATLAAATGRPVSGNATSGNNNWSSGAQGSAAQANSLSYGSLKNRFLAGGSSGKGASGGAAVGANGTGASAGGGGGGSGSAAGGSNKSSKLFSLAR